MLEMSITQKETSLDNSEQEPTWDADTCPTDESLALLKE